ncbi:sugar ABC transporter ATP-binding protein [Nocardioides sp. YIM 152588]|uniref:sugar ABC transporter ATP-binding protein n=1 Tax=Nocardioides sp. YIM 152588 TaxID=3158259 RepID=UPI0032E467ED
MPAEVFAARGVSKRYGGVSALAGAELVLRAGEVHALLGENGAGKSSLVKIIAGVTGHDEGELTLSGEPIRIDNPRAARRHGIAVVSQELNLFPDLDVLTNLFVHDPPTRGGFVDRRAMARAAAPHLEALGVDIPLDRRLGTLSLAEQQLVEITRALIPEPRVLILDEPTSALNVATTGRLLDVVRRIRDVGVAVLYVSHFLQEVASVADRVTVLRDGRNALTDEPAARLTVSDMVHAMLGVEEVPQAEGRAGPARADRRTALRVRDLTVGDEIAGVSFDVGVGEIVGLAGFEGDGPPVVLDTLWGRRRRARGDVRLPSGSTRLPRSTAAAIGQGMALIPSDRKRLGLMLDQTVWENITAAQALTNGQGPAVLRTQRLRDTAQRWVEELHINGYVDTRVSALSGGNQQKVVLAKWLQLEPSLFLLDDPTRGVDVGARAELHAIVRRLAGRGCAVLICSTDMLELAELCDRVLLMRGGRVVREAEEAEMSEAGLVAALNTLPASA